jgi:hypothetical protein
MSRTWKTEPSTNLARMRVRRGPDGRPRPPRIIVHPPAPGDVHLLDKRLLLKLLPYLPVDYRYGLRVIELRGRTSATVGNPYATYTWKEKAIRLYSTPGVAWPIPIGTPRARRIYEAFGATIRHEEERQVILWPSRTDAARFLFGYVFAHELGHHFEYQYRFKWKLRAKLQGSEASADSHRRRLEAWAIFNAVIRKEPSLVSAG